MCTCMHVRLWIISAVVCLKLCRTYPLSYMWSFCLFVCFLPYNKIETSSCGSASLCDFTLPLGVTVSTENGSEASQQRNRTLPILSRQLMLTVYELLFFGFHLDFYSFVSCFFHLYHHFYTTWMETLAYTLTFNICRMWSCPGLGVVCPIVFFLPNLRSMFDETAQ